MTETPAGFPFHQDIVWTPDPATVQKTHLHAFMQHHGIGSMEELNRRSTEDIAWFWDAALKDMDIRFRVPYSRVLDLSDGMPFPKWCVGGRMNIVDNLLDRWLEDGRTAQRLALRYESEEGHILTYSYEAVARQTARVAEALRKDGFGPGDVIGLFMPMTPELLFAFLAIIKIGGVILPLFSGYGPSAVVTRLQDAGAVALFTSNAFPRRGRPIELKPIADEALASCPDVRRVIVHERIPASLVSMVPGRDVRYDDYVRDMPESSPTADTSAEDPMMIIYTSGTTGRPKGAVHTHCGFPLKGAQDMFHAMDVGPGDVMYWMSDMGWMMGPWLVFGTMTIGATMVFADGAPDHPDVGRLWDMVARHGVTHLGLSPVLIRALMPHGPEPVRSADLSRLRAVGSTGSPWDPASWNWVFEHVLERRKPILNYSGGTEISGGIVCGNFLQPLKPCAFSGPVPGMAADVVDENGQPVRGEVGELVIRQPWIGMTRGFWKDRQRYLDSYWSRFPDVWVHGDFAAIDEDGCWFILGRSDDTIKVAGKRLGPAEVEAIVNADPMVVESAAIGVPHDMKGQEVGLFIVPEASLPLPPPGRPAGNELESLRTRLNQAIVSELGKPLKPAFVRFCRSLPKTRNAKVMRRLIQAAYLDAPLGDVSSLEDPGALDAVRDAC
ncbi:MAG: AMP-binding protein [Bacteroidetes bacterium]|nr:AMP-binding protein [Bacteroidota bacterium]